MPIAWVKVFRIIFEIRIFKLTFCANRVMALDLRQNLVSPQYLENKFYICIHIDKI